METRNHGRRQLRRHSLVRLRQMGISTRADSGVGLEPGPDSRAGDGAGNRSRLGVGGVDSVTLTVFGRQAAAEWERGFEDGCRDAAGSRVHFPRPDDSSPYASGYRQGLEVGQRRAS